MANGLLLTHSPRFSVVAFALKTKQQQKKIIHDFNADLKEKGEKKSPGSVPTTSFKVQNLCLLLNKKCVPTAKFQLESSQKLSGKKPNVLQIPFVIVKIT